MTEGRQRVKRGSHFKNNAPATPAIAAIRPAAWHVLFSMEMNHAIPAPAGFHFNFCLVNEHAVSNQP
jgi:hypothetical protein